jgi:hypothetical protein
MTASTLRSHLTAAVTLVVVLAVCLTGLDVRAAEASTGSAAVREAQTLLNRLGYPAGPVDGIDGARTRQGLCAWRRLEGRTTSRAPLTAAELRALRTTTALPRATSGRGASVDRTCQVVFYRNDGRWQKVLPASTGSSGTLPRVGHYRIQRTRAGWHTSTLYSASQPNMYNSMYFDGAIAIHGARHVPPYPASKGCVRVSPNGADWLFARLRVGDPIRVIGRY